MSLFRLAMIFLSRNRRFISIGTLVMARSSAAIAAHGAEAKTAANPAIVAHAAIAAGAYFGLVPPAETPELFAPGIISIPGRSVGRVAFSPDGTECAFTVFESIYTHNRILVTRYENGAWTPQVPMPGPHGRETLEPLFSSDNNRLYFSVKSAGKLPNVDFWETQRTAQGWSASRPLPAPLNSDQNEFCLAQTADGTMYFASRREGGHGGLDLYRTTSRPGQPLQVENLGAPVNSQFDDGDPGLSPDGHILVFYSVSKRPRVTGGSDLFISFDDGQGGWTKPVDLGKGFNTRAAEYGATFSQDGRALFFVRFDGKKGEVYWVSTKALERFRRPPGSPESPEESDDAQAQPLPEKKTVSVPADVLQRYVGTYGADSQSVPASRISLEAGQLMLQAAGQPKVPLFAQSDTQFFLKVVEADLEFVKNERGEVTTLIIHQNGLDFNLPRQAEPAAGDSKP